MDIYRGPDITYQLAYLYANALNVIFMTFLFGVGMPIMFPMAALILFNQHLYQKIRVAYICQDPPLLGKEIVNSVFTIMKYAPLCFLFNAYWILDNPQIFRNKWFYL